MKKTLLLMLSMIFIGGCISGRPTPIPGAGSPEARLYVQKCSPCHSLPSPERQTFKEWRHIIVLMKKRMKSKGITFTPKEEKIILGYLKKHSR